MLNLDTAPLTGVPEGTLAHTGNKLYIYHEHAWHPVGHSEVKELVWSENLGEPSSIRLEADSPFGTWYIGMKKRCLNIDDGTSRRIVARNPNGYDIYEGDWTGNYQELMGQLSLAKQLCQDKFNELVLACLK